jgi:NADH-quinone oxidoreductase subunit E
VSGGKAGHGGLTVIPSDPREISGMVADSIAVRGPAGPEGIVPEPGEPLGESSLAEIARLIKIYPDRRSALLPVLWVAQREQGFVGARAMEQIAAKIGVSPAFVAGVVSFYTMYNIRPVGKYHIQICTSLACYLRGSDRLVDHLKKKLGIDLGETTEDKKYTLARVECLGSCGTAPMLQLNDDYHEDLWPLEKVDSLLESLPE